MTTELSGKVVQAPEIQQTPPPASPKPPANHGLRNLILAIGALLLIAALGFGASKLLGQGGGTPAAAGTGTLNLVATEFAFTPKDYTMAAPGSLKVDLKNNGSIEHDLVIEGVDGRIVAPAKKSVEATFQLPKDGTYTYFCSIPGHREAGMQGTITVGSAQQASAAPAAPAGMAAHTAPQVAPADPNAKPLPAPQMAPPVNRTEPATVNVNLETKEVVATMADGVTYKYWTFNGTVPGPMIRVRQGDTVVLTLKNAADSQVTHSIDLHAVTGPGGGAKVMQVSPGGTNSFTFKALNAGVYVYHCATPMVAMHMANGMYGMIVVEPPEGLAPVDHEFYLMQGDFYIKGDRGQAGMQDFSLTKMLDEQPDYVLFNGAVGSLTGQNSFKAKVGDKVRIFFGNGGPNLVSSFHIIGEIFDNVHPEGATQALNNVQTTIVPAGGATMVEFTLQVPGSYTIVDHSISRLEKGAVGSIDVTGDPNPDVFKPAQGN